ncbi:hypothetical protein LUX02_01760 [Streptomyces somaliensis]|nr:hypothetical protein [Streptomyces somaliensis]
MSRIPGRGPSTALTDPLNKATTFARSRSSTGADIASNRAVFCTSGD